MLMLVTAVSAAAQTQQFQSPKGSSARRAAFQAEPRIQPATLQTVAPTRIEGMDQDSGRPSQLARMAAAAPVATTSTPFVQQVDVRLASIWGGRVALGGFQSVHPMEKLLYGLPGSGLRPSSGAGSRANPGVMAPGDSESFGLSLTVALGPSNSGSGRADAWRCLARVIGIRGCRLN